IHHAAEPGQLQSPCISVLRRRTVGPDQVPGFRPQKLTRPGRLRIHIHAPLGEPVSGDPDQGRPQPAVDVEGGGERELDGALELLPRTAPPRSPRGGPARTRPRRAETKMATSDTSQSRSASPKYGALKRNSTRSRSVTTATPPSARRSPRSSANFDPFADH